MLSPKSHVWPHAKEKKEHTMGQLQLYHVGMRLLTLKTPAWHRLGQRITRTTSALSLGGFIMKTKDRVGEYNSFISVTLMPAPEHPYVLDLNLRVRTRV